MSIMDQLLYLARVATVAPAAKITLDGACEWRDDRPRLRAAIDHCRQTTSDEITEHIAVYLALAAVGLMHITPCGDCQHTFQITKDGRPVPLEEIPPDALARSRMMTAVANQDPLAARDVFIAYTRAYPERVTEFIAEFATQVAARAEAQEGRSSS